VTYHDPHVPTFYLPDKSSMASVPLNALIEESEVVVVVTPHKDVDWPRVYEQADLVVDTTNSSTGHRVRPRQVLRLGAGWVTASARALAGSQQGMR
jgi:UDP-N-acetyl-D-glucosamine dehydrogenase